MIQNLHEASFLLPEVVLHTGRTDTQPRITKTEEMQLWHNADCIKIQLLPKNANECCVTAYFLLFIKIFPLPFTLLCVTLLMWEALCLSDCTVVDWFQQEGMVTWILKSLSSTRPSGPDINTHQSANQLTQHLFVVQKVFFFLENKEIERNVLNISR